jgi:predicted SAM-dependent methyltransferase
MPLGSVSLSRPPTSYAKVQAWVGRAIRNRGCQLRRGRIADLKYLDVGCGRNTHDAFINLDYFWHPQVDVCWDVRRGLPFPDQSMRGVFSEHCLEHFPLPAGQAILREILRVLLPGGTVRLVVPDGELYLRTYFQQVFGDKSQHFPFQEAESRQPLWTPMASVNRVFYQDRESPFGHRTIYDFALLSTLLRDCGYATIQKCRFGEGRDGRLLIDTPARAIESLYVEATKA